MARHEIMIVSDLRISEGGVPQFEFVVGQPARSMWADLFEHGTSRTPQDIYDAQQREPVQLAGQIWVYRGKLLSFAATSDVECARNDLHYQEWCLLIKHHVLREERRCERLRHQVEAMEYAASHPIREPIPEVVRMRVWQRDGGRCVKCGSRDRLEFDHIIPIAEGGNNTERNIELLCETCNRQKGRSV
jgi:hypothetical protein